MVVIEPIGLWFLVSLRFFFLQLLQPVLLDAFRELGQLV